MKYSICMKNKRFFYCDPQDADQIYKKINNLLKSDLDFDESADLLFLFDYRRSSAKDFFDSFARIVKDSMNHRTSNLAIEMLASISNIKEEVVVITKNNYKEIINKLLYEVDEKEINKYCNRSDFITFIEISYNHYRDIEDGIKKGVKKCY